MGDTKYKNDGFKEYIKGNGKEFENCVNCGQVTTEEKETLIDLRGEYVEGAGQLCLTCYSNLM